MRSYFRLLSICWTLSRFGISDLFKPVVKSRFLRFVLGILPQSSKYQAFSAPQRLRMALEKLGPIFVKFGQVLSTRPDILPENFAQELSQLQDNVPPFSSELAIVQIENSLKHSVDDLFIDFNKEPVASASIAQVHRAYLKQADNQRGHKVAIKVLRPNILRQIEKDLALLKTLAIWAEKLLPDGKRLKPQEVVAEFNKYLHDEVNLLNEAANASLFKRQFHNSPMLITPEVYYDYCSECVLTMEWMEGTPIADTATLKEKNIDFKQLARFGVEIFFTQVFQNGFFHADMHPGNIFVANDGRYVALDFGIVGTLTDYDKRYLAINFLAFFNRDYHRVATAHIESGWVPEDTRAEELEAAIRAVCEPFFNKPLSQISFGLVLMRLFETSRRFNVEIQPQLVLLQKTLLNIEGLGRQLDPDLDLWDTAKPFLTNWMKEQVGFRALIKNIKKEAPDWANILPALPRKVNDLLNDKQYHILSECFSELVKVQRKQNFCLAIIALLLIGLIVVYFMK